MRWRKILGEPGPEPMQKGADEKAFACIAGHPSNSVHNSPKVSENGQVVDSQLVVSSSSSSSSSLYTETEGTQTKHAKAPLVTSVPDLTILSRAAALAGIPESERGIIERYIDVLGGQVRVDVPTRGIPFDRWQQQEMRKQFDEYYAAGPLPPEPRPKVGDTVTGVCGDRHVRLVWHGRWEMLADSLDSKTMRRRKDFASPHLDHAKRTAILWYGAAKSWSDEVAV